MKSATSSGTQVRDLCFVHVLEKALDAQVEHPLVDGAMATDPSILREDIESHSCQRRHDVLVKLRDRVPLRVRTASVPTTAMVNLSENRPINIEQQEQHHCDGLSTLPITRGEQAQQVTTTEDLQPRVQLFPSTRDEEGACCQRAV